MSARFQYAFPSTEPYKRLKNFGHAVKVESAPAANSIGFGFLSKGVIETVNAANATISMRVAAK
jgi:hypothetical protein